LILPLALLLASTDLPFGEAILSLKPCLFFRFVLEGWYVLFMADGLKTGSAILCNFWVRYKSQLPVCEWNKSSTTGPNDKAHGLRASKS
jgi:hypothetical protein